MISFREGWKVMRSEYQCDESDDVTLNVIDVSCMHHDDKIEMMIGNSDFSLTVSNQVSSCGPQLLALGHPNDPIHSPKDAENHVHAIPDSRPMPEARVPSQSTLMATSHALPHVRCQ